MMISILNLIWIIPVSMAAGMFVMALAHAATDRDEWKEQYESKTR